MTLGNPASYIQHGYWNQSWLSAPFIFIQSLYRLCSTLRVSAFSLWYFQESNGKIDPDLHSLQQKNLFQDDSSQFGKKARENYVTTGHVTDVTSDYGVTSGHVTDVTFGYEDTSGRVTDVTSSYVATSISTEQQQQYSQSNDEESYYILKTNNPLLFFLRTSML